MFFGAPAQLLMCLSRGDKTWALQKSITIGHVVKETAQATEVEITCCPDYRAFSRDVTAAILVLQNEVTAAILLYQTSALGVELYFYANIVFCFSKPTPDLSPVVSHGLVDY